MSDFDALARRIANSLDFKEFIRVPKYLSGTRTMELVEACISNVLREALPTSEAKLLTPEQVERARKLLPRLELCATTAAQVAVVQAVDLLLEVVGDPPPPPTAETIDSVLSQLHGGIEGFRDRFDPHREYHTDDLDQLMREAARVIEHLKRPTP